MRPNLVNIFRQPDQDRIRETAGRVGVLLAKYGDLRGEFVAPNQADDLHPGNLPRRTLQIHEWGFACRYVTTFYLPVSEHPIDYEDITINTVNDDSLPPIYSKTYSVKANTPVTNEIHKMKPHKALKVLKKARKELERRETDRLKLWNSSLS